MAATLQRPLVLVGSSRPGNGTFYGLNGQTVVGDASGAWAVTANGTGQNITLTPSGTSGAVIIAGQTQTGASSGIASRITQTWNTTGRPAALSIEVTDTASGNPLGNGVTDSAALLRMTYGSSAFFVGKGTGGNIFTSIYGPVGVGNGPGYFACLNGDTEARIAMTVNTAGVAELSFGDGTSRQTFLTRVASKQLALNGVFHWGDGTNAQIARLSYASVGGDPLITAKAGKGLQLGTNDGTTALTLDSSQNATFAGQLRITNSFTPASAAASGSAGTIAWDTNYFYVCTAANTWKRAALATW